MKGRSLTLQGLVGSVQCFDAHSARARTLGWGGAGGRGLVVALEDLALNKVREALEKGCLVESQVDGKSWAVL